jgi:hypothetical protein
VLKHPFTDLSGLNVCSATCGEALRSELALDRPEHVRAAVHASFLEASELSCAWCRKERSVASCPHASAAYGDGDDGEILTCEACGIELDRSEYQDDEGAPVRVPSVEEVERPGRKGLKLLFAVTIGIPALLVLIQLTSLALTGKTPVAPIAMNSPGSTAAPSTWQPLDAAGAAETTTSSTSTTTTTFEPPATTSTTVPRNEPMPIIRSTWSLTEEKAVYYHFRDRGASQQRAGCIVIQLAWHLTPDQAFNMDALAPDFREYVLGQISSRCG